MSLSPFVFDASAENFNRLVLENSHKGPVLVHFWTPKAGPCFMLMPRLIKLATGYQGKFLLVMVNTDELGALAQRRCLRSNFFCAAKSSTRSTAPISTAVFAKFWIAL